MEEENGAEEKPAAAIKKHTPPPRKASPPAPAPAAPVRQNPNMDRGSAERLRKGSYPIDARLDLHGMSAQRAHAALEAFVSAQFERGSRCLLVITGKGKESGGVLRRSLAGWLEAPALRPMILSLETAQPKHGGNGASYVLLRRRR